jgi:peptide/nickel transport system substrate-binding protein
MRFTRNYYVILLALILVLVGCTPDSSSNESSKGNESDQKGKAGGTLKIAYPTQPTTLDPTITTADATRDPARLIYETLVTLNEDYEVTPMLAKSYEISEDGKTYTFTLREGIKFHNGKEMKSDDVVVSMEKWSESAVAKSNLGVHKWVAKDEYTVELQVDKPSSVLMLVLAEPSQIAAIMPKEVVEAAGPGGVKEYVGTGPFKFEEWKQNQHIHFTKFDDYVTDDKPTSGLAGKKEALVDEIYHNFVGDAATRITGLIGSEYDFAHMLPYDAVSQVENTPGFVVDVWPYGDEMMVFNKKQGFFKNVKARQAVNYGLDKEAVARAAFTDEKYYKLGPSLFLPNQAEWYTDAGKELYNPKDLNKAKKLLKEAGYKGEEIVILTSRDYEHHYNAAVATQQQLKEMGVNAKLDVYDWPTLLDRREQPDKWDIFYTAMPITTTPHQYTFFSSSSQWPGWTNNPEFDRLLEEIKSQDTQEKAKEKYTELQQLMWEDLPVINVTKNNRVSAYSETVKGYKEFIGPIFWNTTVQ